MSVPRNAQPAGAAPVPEDEVLRALRAAASGLTYPSESDEPIEAFLWPEDRSTTGAAVDQVKAHALSAGKVEEVALDAFFADLAATNDPDRVRNLRGLVQSSLAEVKVFRAGVGQTDVNVFLIGRTRSRNWAGLRTRSVET